MIRLKLDRLASADRRADSSSPTVCTSWPFADPEDLRDFVVGPIEDVVERSFEQESLGRVAVVVEDHHDRVEAVSRDRRELHAGHLERTVAHDDQDPRIGVGHAGSDRRRNAEAHRRVIGRAEELGVPVHLEVGRAEEGIADVGDDRHVGLFGQDLVEPGEQVRRSQLGSLDRPRPFARTGSSVAAPASWQP